MDTGAGAKGLLFMGAVACAVWLTTTTAAATPTTITFDVGAYDETIVSPGGEIHGPFDWLEAGFRVEGFWATDVGTASGDFQLGHTHLAPNYNGGATGRAEWHHAWTNDLQGLYITAEDGAAFDVLSISYRLSRRESSDPEQQRLAWSYGVDDPQMLLATEFDPSAADFESGWLAIAIDDFGESPKPWVSQSITGLHDITGLYLSSTAARVLFDNIVLEKSGASTSSPVPEPSTGLLVGLGLALVGGLRQGRVAD